MPTNITQIKDSVLKEFDERFPWAIIDWKIGKENDGDGSVTDKMKEIKSFLSQLIPKVIEQAFDATKVTDGELNLREINNVFMVISKVADRQRSFLEN